MARQTKLWSTLAAIAALFVVLTACRASAPAPSAAPATPPAAAPAATDEWQKVIDAAQKEGKLTLYVSAMSPATIQALTNGFKSKYGITTEWVQGSGPSNLEKIRNEQAAKAYTADVYQFGASIGWAAKEAKALVPWPDLPVLKEKGVWRTEPFSFDPKDRMMAVGLDESPPGGQASFVNTKLVTPDKEPKTWQDLLNPQWQGKIIMMDPTVAGPSSDIFTHFRRAGIVTPDYFEKLAKQKPAFIRDYRGQIEAVSRGEYPIGFGSAFGIFAPPMVDAGAPLKPVFFKEGVLVSYWVMAFVANAPHPNAARLFTNFVLTKEGQTLWAQGAQGVSLRTDVTNFAPPYLRIPPDVRRIPYDWDSLTQENQEIKDRVAAKIFDIK